MPPTLDVVLTDVMKLSPRERVDPAEALVVSVLQAPALHPDWQAEIARRVADMDAGGTRFIAADEALMALAVRIEKRRPRG